ncbi:undecaprenyl/decaprenyl-phosphate alpha-N-acetylglucosaminyl 1-phosphate transferase [candidate division KSB1 bacterium]|nr:undecaprenyl/decaprenyl-phosphate alpha-N-acetylglucosaminyl 1-phosphate transferase [candidate division KSB1 bacterium]RQW01081.1 MAG: undecaprenyl/decaprenyl-phosphate alpha-N-acetylglucosaminyl 1-phosphate transferase [candidate division KSB1 bacterium]
MHTLFLYNQLWRLPLLCCVFTIVLIPYCIRIASLMHAIDKPGALKIHSTATPRCGGMAIFTSIIFSLILFPSILALLPVVSVIFFSASMSGIFVLGVVDDIKNLPAGKKLLWQMLCTFVVVLGLATLYRTELIVVLPLFVYILFFTNSFNLIDGMDGLAGGLAFIAAMALAIVAFFMRHQVVLFFSLLLAGCAAGFLVFNSHPAKIFLGDCGSTFLGFTLAVLSGMLWLKSNNTLLFIPLLLITSVPLCDTTAVLLKRIIHKKPILAGDRNHLYDMLLRKGFSMSQTLVTFYFAAILFAVLGLVIFIMFMQ